MVVAARHHLLQQHLVGVAAGVDGAHDLGGFVGGMGGVDLFHTVKGEFPVIHAGAGLDDQGVAKAQLFLAQFGGVHGRGQHLGGGVGNAEFVADLVELRLFLHGGVQVGGGTGGDVLRQLCLAADDHGGVIVGAAEQVQPLTGMLCGKVL